MNLNDKLAKALPDAHLIGWPAFAELVEDRMRELITLDTDNDEFAWERRKQIYRELAEYANWKLKHGPLA